MLVNFVPLFIFLLYLDYIHSQGQFECGEHGRFEYCIDEIPGCVVGCHCHPGYYFDTETKICEPNIKLNKGYRRRNPVEILPSDPIISGEVTEFTPITTIDLINEQVDEMTKNADDLGDWLYNQFFKTIENQVINNTKESGVQTRRNGVQPPPNKMNLRRSPRKKSKKLKKKHRKSSMRRKLLRITENDSIFDSSQSRSESSESSSYESSDETFEISSNREKHQTDKEHGHRKIVVINKKPKPPLPSFIFLPNMDTPFYPPIGLPPPPVMPMYPLVPIPPVPAFPCPDHDTTEGSTSITTTEMTITTKAATIKEETEPITTDVNETEDLTPETQEPVITTEKAGRSGSYKKRNRKKPFNMKRGSSQIKGKQGNRQKLLQKLRQRMKNNANLRPLIESLNVNRDDIQETPLTEDNLYEETLNNEIQYNRDSYKNKKPENVDFKYISELIHRVDLNNSLLPPIEYNPKDSIESFKPHNLPMMKNENSKPPLETRRSNLDDPYYAYLGRQIASIIRNVDAQNEQVDIEIEKTDQNNENHVFFNNNSPGSFWERSVRSPLKYFESNNNKYDYLKKSNELLFNIENKVSIMASTAPSLTLQEIENIVNIMENVQNKMKNKRINYKHDKTSERSLNFNLWPQENQSTRNSFKKVILKPTSKGDAKQSVPTNREKKLPEIKGLSMHSIQRVTAWLNMNGKINQTKHSEPPSNISPSDAQITLPKPILHSAPDYRRKVSEYPKPAPLEDYPISNNHYTGLNKYFQDSPIAVEDGSALLVKRGRQLIKPIDQQPSYFHHGINHFAYFD